MLKAWQPSSLYKIVAKIMSSFGLGKEDYLKAITKLEVCKTLISGDAFVGKALVLSLTINRCFN